MRKTLSLAISACGATPSNGSGNQSPTPTTFTGQWTLNSVVDKHRSVTTDVTKLGASVEIERSFIKSFDGCNHGTANLSIDDSTMKTSDPMFTAQGCKDAGSLTLVRGAMAELYSSSGAPIARAVNALTVQTVGFTLTFTKSS